MWNREIQTLTLLLRWHLHDHILRLLAETRPHIVDVALPEKESVGDWSASVYSPIRIIDWLSQSLEAPRLHSWGSISFIDWPPAAGTVPYLHYPTVPVVVTVRRGGVHGEQLLRAVDLQFVGSGFPVYRIRTIPGPTVSPTSRFSVEMGTILGTSVRA